MSAFIYLSKYGTAFPIEEVHTTNKIQCDLNKAFNKGTSWLSLCGVLLGCSDVGVAFF